MRTALAVLGIGVVAVGMWLTARYVGGYFWHPLAEGNSSTCGAHDHSGCGYSFWSGSASDIGEVTLVFGLGAFLGAWWRKHNCHVHRCWRLQWHPHPAHGHPVCGKHHPFGQGRADHLHERHHTLEAHANTTVTGTATGYTTVTGTATGFGSFDVQVGDATPETEKPKRQRKPGTKPVTDIKSKRGE
jgi:hypothetical protein